MIFPPKQNPSYMIFFNKVAVGGGHYNGSKIGDLLPFKEKRFELIMDGS